MSEEWRGAVRRFACLLFNKRLRNLCFLSLSFFARINNVSVYSCCHFRGTDDVEKSLELLDKVLSEFEEETENSPPGEPESPSQGHQSEDDGYMSMNGRR